VCHVPLVFFGRRLAEDTKRNAHYALHSHPLGKQKIKGLLKEKEEEAQPHAPTALQALSGVQTTLLSVLHARLAHTNQHHHTQTHKTAHCVQQAHLRQRREPLPALHVSQTIMLHAMALLHVCSVHNTGSIYLYFVALIKCFYFIFFAQKHWQPSQCMG